MSVNIEGGAGLRARQYGPMAATEGRPTGLPTFLTPTRLCRRRFDALALTLDRGYKKILATRAVMASFAHVARSCADRCKRIVFAFKWLLSGETPREVSLCIHGLQGWFGRKVLTCDGETIVRRGWFEGIETRFTIPGDLRQFRLQMVPISDSADWRPALFADGLEVPETTGNAPPRIVRPPASLYVPVGLTYLLMFLAVVMSPQASKILDALYLHFDDRKAVLTVTDPRGSVGKLSFERAQLPPAAQGQPYSAQLKAVGGTPPYRWKPEKKQWPKGLSLDEKTGDLSCTPAYPRDYAATVLLSDSSKSKEESDSSKSEEESVACPIAWVVRPAVPPGQDWPTIITMSLPSATVGEPYDCQMEFERGKPPHRWKTVGKKRLPKGLKLDRHTGRIHGTPEEAGYYALTLRVIDDHYAASRDIVPWILPILATAVCLLGFVSMRKWGVLLYAVLIVLQVGCAVVAVLPISIIALGLQIFLWLVGAAHLGKMH